MIAGAAGCGWRGHGTRCAGVLTAGLVLVISGCGAEPSTAPDRPGPSIVESAPPTLSPETAALLERLEMLRRGQREDEALELARAFLAEHPDTPRLHYAIGVLLGSKEDHRAAIAALGLELAADPGHFESYRAMAAAHMRLGEAEAALPHLETCLAMRPDHVDTRFQLGRMLSALGRWDEAEPHLAAAASARDDGDTWSEMGLLHRRRGDSERAIVAFRRALELDADNTVVLLNLGQLLVRTGEVEEGTSLLERHRQRAVLEDRLDHLRRSSRLAGATAANFAALGDVEIRLGLRDEAVTAYRRALELDPGFAAAALGLASLLLERGEVDEATRWAVVALMGAPGSLRTHYVLGMTRLHKNQYEEAELAFEASRALGEWDLQAWLRVADAYLRAGETRRAERTLDGASAALGEVPEVAALRARATELRARPPEAVLPGG